MKSIIIGDCQLIHGDSIEVMERNSPGAYPEATIKAIISDPPYKLTSGGKNGLMGGCLDPDEYDNSGALVDCSIDWPDFMPLMHKALELSGGGHAYIMANNRNVQAMLNAAEAAGFGFHNILVWDKGAGTPNRWYMKNCEFTGLFYAGKAQRINDCGSMQLIRMPQVDASGEFAIDGKAHPTEKPVALMQHYIENSTQPGDIVLDPFMGSGTTGVAAIRSGRKFIGIEKDAEWFDVACKRLRAAYDNFQPSLL